MRRLPPELWLLVLDHASSSGDAACLACTCRDAANAYRFSRAFRAVRVVRASTDGWIEGELLEPASGSFDVVLTPNDVGGIGRCPREGTVLLLPGTYQGLALSPASLDVHVFGRGQARLSSLTCSASRASFVGVNFDGAVSVFDSCLRFQRCTVQGVLLCVGNATAFDRCELKDNVHVTASSTARFARCVFEKQTRVTRDAAPVFAANTFRNGDSGFGVSVEDSRITFVSNDVQPGRPDFAFPTVGIGLNHAHDCVIERNTIGACSTGIQMVDSTAIIAGNELWNVGTNVSLHRASRATVTGNHMRCVGNACRGIAVSGEGTGGTFSGNALSWHAINVLVVGPLTTLTVTDNVFRSSLIGVYFTDGQARVSALKNNQLIDVDHPKFSLVRHRLANVAFATGVIGGVCFGRILGLGMMGIRLLAGEFCVMVGIGAAIGACYHF